MVFPDSAHTYLATSSGSIMFKDILKTPSVFYFSALASKCNKHGPHGTFRDAVFRTAANE